MSENSAYPKKLIEVALPLEAINKASGGKINPSGASEHATFVVGAAAPIQPGCEK